MHTLLTDCGAALDGSSCACGLTLQANVEICEHLLAFTVAALITRRSWLKAFCRVSIFSLLCTEAVVAQSTVR